MRADTMARLRRSRPRSSRHSLFLLVCLLVSQLATTSLGALVNSEVAVGMDASAGFVRVQANMRLRNDGPAEERTVRLATPGGTGAILVSQGKKLERATRRPVLRSADDREAFQVELAESLEVGDEVSLVVAYELPDALSPSPAEIKEGEDHFVELSMPALFWSPYRTERLKASAKFASRPAGNVVSAPEPFKVERSSVALGPYAELPPFWDSPLKLRFKSNRAMLVSTEAVREMYVSHWGNIAAKEEFHVENAAARHVGRWSRIDYEKGSLSPLQAHTAIGDVWVNLPKRSTNVVYKDLVGNITTSRMRKPNSKHVPVQLTFRFPLLGGWKNLFWYTYDIPLSDFAQSSGLSHRVKVPVYPSINEKFLCRRLVIRVLLPEGAKNVAVQSHSSLQFSVKESVEKTTLNYFGRTVVTLEASNVFANLPGHDKHVYVTYDFAPLMLLAAPLLVATGIFAMFLAFIVYAGADLRLVPEEEDPKARAAAIVTDQHIRVAAVIKKLDASHEELDALFTVLSSASDGGSVMASRLSVEGNLQRQEAELLAAAAELKRIGSDSAEIAGALGKRFAEKRDLCMKAISSKLMLLEGRMSEEKYSKQVEGAIAMDLSKICEELDALAEALLEHM